MAEDALLEKLSERIESLEEESARLESELDSVLTELHDLRYRHKRRRWFLSH